MAFFMTREKRTCCRRIRLVKLPVIIFRYAFAAAKNAFTKLHVGCTTIDKNRFDTNGI